MENFESEMFTLHKLYQQSLIDIEIDLFTLKAKFLFLSPIKIHLISVKLNISRSNWFLKNATMSYPEF